MYNIGDRVQIVQKWKPGCRQNLAGEMDKWLGTVMTIKQILGGDTYKMVEDYGEGSLRDGWFWNDLCIQGLAVENIPETDDIINFL